MTCIVGVAHAGQVYVGGDSAGVNPGSYALRVRRDVKVFVNGPFAMGFTSSFRMGQLLHYALTPPPHEPPDLNVHHYMVTRFVDAVRACLKDGGYARKEHEQEEGGVFLVGYRGRLFRIASDYQVGEAVDGYDAVGSGDQAALGALHATQGQDPVERVFTALQAAERLNAGVRGPFTVVSVATSPEQLPAAAQPSPPDASDGEPDNGSGTSSSSAA